MAMARAFDGSNYTVGKVDFSRYIKRFPLLKFIWQTLELTIERKLSNFQFIFSLEGTSRNVHFSVLQTVAQNNKII